MKFNPRQFMSFIPATSLDETFVYLLAFLVFLANLKLLKLMRLNHRIYLFTKTLSKAALPLFSFLVVFLVFYIAFSFLFYSIYGSVLPEYRSFLTTIETLFSAVMGGFDFETVQANNRLLGPVIFFSFHMVMVMILMNVFSTILKDSFAEVQAGEHLKSKDYEVVNLVPRVLSYPLSQRFGHPLLILLQLFGHPPVPSRDAQIPSVLVIPSKKMLDFAGKSKTF